MNCIKCGKEISDEVKFCPSCGSTAPTGARTDGNIGQASYKAGQTPPTIAVSPTTRNRPGIPTSSKQNKNKMFYILIAIVGVTVLLGLAIQFDIFDKIKGKEAITEQEARDFVEKWKNAWITGIDTGNISYYQQLYDTTEFRAPYRNKGYSEYMEERSKSASKTNLVFLDISDVMVKKEEGSNRVRVEFMQDYLSDRWGDTGKKTLVLAKKDDNIRIVLEDFIESSTPKMITRSQILRYIENWRAAWEATCNQKTISYYKSLYAPDFYSYYKGTDYNQYMKERDGIGKRATVLLVTVDNSSLQFGALKDRVVTSFNQTYQSDKYADYGIKIVVLAFRDGHWLITREEFKLSKKLKKLDIEDLTDY